MSNPKWDDVDESVGEMVDALETIMDRNHLIQEYISNLDAQTIKKADAKVWGDAYHLSQVVDAAHCTLCELSVNLFNALQKAKGRSVGW